MRKQPLSLVDENYDTVIAHVGNNDIVNNNDMVNN